MSSKSNLYKGVPKNAKNKSNQRALDALRALAVQPRYANSAHYPHTFRKGMTSLAKCPFAITTAEEASSLKGIGGFLAGIIASNAGGDGAVDGSPPAAKRTSSKGATRVRKKAAKKNAEAIPVPSSSSSGAASQYLRRSDSASSAPASLSVNTSYASSAGTKSTKTPRTAARDLLRRCNSLPSDSSPPTLATSAKPRPSAKLLAHRKAVKTAEVLTARLTDYDEWKVVLLVDRRERQADHVSAKLKMSGLDCEVRQLPIGDMLWIARGTKRGVCATAGGGGATVAEVVLGTVVERKTLPDLASSLFGTRYEEQRLRLRESASGASQVFYLVESAELTDLPNCPASTLKYAMMETMIGLGFAIVRTKGLDDTVRTLKRIHRRLVRRSFPMEFAVAATGDVGRGGGIRSIPSFASPPTGRRRNQEESMVFAVPPVPYDDEPRFATYDEFKTKLELDRESGTRSVRAIHRAMLKQVEGMSHRKVHAVTNRYPTPNELFRAYGDALHGEGGGIDAAERLVENVRTNDRVTRHCRIGPKSAAELCRVYTLGGQFGGSGVGERKRGRPETGGGGNDNGDRDDFYVNGAARRPEQISEAVTGSSSDANDGVGTEPTPKRRHAGKNKAKVSQRSQSGVSVEPIGVGGGRKGSIDSIAIDDGDDESPVRTASSSSSSSSMVAAGVAPRGEVPKWRSPLASQSPDSAATPALPSGGSILSFRGEFAKDAVALAAAVRASEQVGRTKGDSGVHRSGGSSSSASSSSLSFLSKSRRRSPFSGGPEGDQAVSRSARVATKDGSCFDLTIDSDNDEEGAEIEESHALSCQVSFAGGADGQRKNAGSLDSGGGTRTSPSLTFDDEGGNDESSLDSSDDEGLVVRLQKRLGGSTQGALVPPCSTARAARSVTASSNDSVGGDSNGGKACSGPASGVGVTASRDPLVDVSLNAKQIAHPHTGIERLVTTQPCEDVRRDRIAIKDPIEVIEID